MSILKFKQNLLTVPDGIGCYGKKRMKYIENPGFNRAYQWADISSYGYQHVYKSGNGKKFTVLSRKAYREQMSPLEIEDYYLGGKIYPRSEDTEPFIHGGGRYMSCSYDTGIPPDYRSNDVGMKMEFGIYGEDGIEIGFFKIESENGAFVYYVSVERVDLALFCWPMNPLFLREIAGMVRAEYIPRSMPIQVGQFKEPPVRITRITDSLYRAPLGVLARVNSDQLVRHIYSANFQPHRSGWFSVVKEDGFGAIPSYSVKKGEIIFFTGNKASRILVSYCDGDSFYYCRVQTRVSPLLIMKMIFLKEYVPKDESSLKFARIFDGLVSKLGHSMAFDLMSQVVNKRGYSKWDLVSPKEYCEDMVSYSPLVNVDLKIYDFYSPKRKRLASGDRLAAIAGGYHCAVVVKDGCVIMRSENVPSMLNLSSNETDVRGYISLLLEDDKCEFVCQRRTLLEWAPVPRPFIYDSDDVFGHVPMPSSCAFDNGEWEPGVYKKFTNVVRCSTEFFEYAVVTKGLTIHNGVITRDDDVNSSLHLMFKGCVGSELSHFPFSLDTGNEEWSGVLVLIGDRFMVSPYTANKSSYLYDRNRSVRLMKLLKYIM